MQAQEESLAIHLAEARDAEAIARLVNLAYRSKLINNGWTNESQLVAGRRIDEESVLALMQQPQSVILKASMDKRLLACAHLLNTDATVYLGMLSVSPEVQGMGIGKHMLQQAEDYAWNNMEAEAIIMDVISQRTELISFYQRRGYSIHGQEKEYPVHLDVGQPLQNNLTIRQLIKNK